MIKELEIKEVITRNKLFSEEIKQKKIRLINTATTWNGKTTKGSYVFHKIWESKDKHFKVCLGKYGKEYYLKTIKWKNGTTSNNPNDMRPTIFINGKEKEFDASFDHVFNFLQSMWKVSEDALRVLGCLFFRNALLVDHIVTNKTISYCPPQKAIDFITSKFPKYDGISTEAYIYYLDAIAWNEDVKYHTLGYDLNQGIGRTNNMKTYANVISVLLGGTPLSKLCSSFSRPPIGVAPITNKDASTTFTELKLKL